METKLRDSWCCWISRWTCHVFTARQSVRIASWLDVISLLAVVGLQDVDGQCSPVPFIFQRWVMFKSIQLTFYLWYTLWLKRVFHEIWFSMLDSTKVDDWWVAILQVIQQLGSRRIVGRYHISANGPRVASYQCKVKCKLCDHKAQKVVCSTVCLDFQFFERHCRTNNETLILRLLRRSLARKEKAYHGIKALVKTHSRSHQTSNLNYWSLDLKAPKLWEENAESLSIGAVQP